MPTGIVISYAASAALTLGMPTVIADGAGFCPASQQVQAALAEQLGADQATGWTIRYAPAGQDAIGVVVRDASGALRAQRKVSARATSCAAAAKTVAAIAARAVAPLAWEPPAGAIAARADDEGPTADPTSKGIVPRLMIAVGPAFASAPAAHANLLIDLGLRLSTQWSLRLGVLPLPAANIEPVGRAGSARLREVATFLAPTWSTRAFDTVISVGPTASLAFDDARTTGISQPSVGRRGILRGGLMVGATRPVAGRWRMGLLASLQTHVAGAEFAVVTDAGEQVALRAPRIAGLAALRIERVLLP